MAGCNGCDGKGTWFSPIRGDIECDRCGGSGELAGVKPDKNGDVVPQHVWKSAFDRYRDLCIAQAYFPNMTQAELDDLDWHNDFKLVEPPEDIEDTIAKLTTYKDRMIGLSFAPALLGEELTHFSFVD